MRVAFLSLCCVGFFACSDPVTPPADSVVSDVTESDGARSDGASDSQIIAPDSGNAVDAQTSSDSGAVSDTGSSSKPPNILLVIADDLGLDASPCYGWESATATTPVLDALCTQSVRFDAVWSNPTCSPTRASILTGRYPFRTGVGGPTGGPDAPGISLSEYSIPKALDALTNKTYAHANIGKWHLGDKKNGAEDSPNEMGYDFFSGQISGVLPDFFAWTKITNGVSFEVTEYATTETVNDAIGWLDSVTGPWFLWLAFNAPHTPYHVPPQGLYSQALAQGADCTGKRLGRCFRASIEALDAELSRLLDAIGDPDFENTYVIFIGDNGTAGKVLQGYAQGHGKDSLYQGGIHVPLFIAGPGVVNPGRSVSELVDVTDIYATVLQMAGAQPPTTTPDGKPIDGRSLVPHLESEDAGPHRSFALAELLSSQANTEGRGRAIRDERYKLITWKNGSSAFFDLQTDPLESTDLLQGPLTESAQKAYDGLVLKSESMQ